MTPAPSCSLGFVVSVVMNLPASDGGPASKFDAPGMHNGPTTVFDIINCTAGDCVGRLGMAGFRDFPETGSRPSGTGSSLDFRGR